MKKKALSLILCICVLFSAFGMFSTAASAADGGSKYSISDGLSKLRSQFQFGMAANGMDYNFFSPVKSGSDKTKYPLVIWIHGFFSGAAPGLQVTNNDIAYWTSKEFQARFPAGGAFVICPRSKEAIDIWSDMMADDLKYCLDYFISKHSANIDTGRIYIGGLSTGAKMTYTMCVKYPQMFAAAFPCSPTGVLTGADSQKLSNIPVWLLAAVHDDRASYAVQVADWKKIVASSSVRSSCRIAVFSGWDMLYPNGSRVDHPHDTWYAATYDMFTDKNEPYYNMSIINGNGSTVNLTYPNGMISWLSQFRTSYSGNPITVKSSAYNLVLGIVYGIINHFVITFGIKGIA